MKKIIILLLALLLSACSAVKPAETLSITKGHTEYSAPMVQANRWAWCIAAAEMVHSFRADGAQVFSCIAQPFRLN